MFFKLFAIAFPAMLAIDFVWLSIVAGGFYRSQLGSLMKDQVTWAPALILYVLLAVGMLVFVVEPALAKGSWVHALMYGALLGFITYAAYDLTNLATLKNWPLMVSLVDMAWGATLVASVSTITYFIATKLGF